MAVNSDTLGALVSITQFDKGRAKKIFKRAKVEGKLVVLKNNAPEAVILSPEEFKRMSEIEEDYYLLTLAQERLANDNIKNAIPLEEVMRDLGISREDVDAAEELEIE